MERLEIPIGRATDAVRNRDFGLVSDGITHMVALRWPRTGKLTLVHGGITRTERDPTGSRVEVQSVLANLAIELEPELPAGTLRRDQDFQEILGMIATSFGRRVSCSSTSEFAHLYAGPWDGTLPPRIEGGPGTLCFTGSFNPDAMTCELVWAFDLDRYQEWFRTRSA